MIRVLVVDDSPQFRAAAKDVVAAAHGFELAGVAESGEEGVELARISRPDLALVDLHMPGIDGHETVARLATESPTTSTVLMTATPDPTGESNGLFDKRRLSPAALARLWEQAQAPSAS